MHAKIDNPGDIEEALLRYHTKLVSVILRELESSPLENIVEIGPGSGRFTLPLLEGLNYEFHTYTCVDPYPGPYSQDLEALRSKLVDKHLDDRVGIIKEDASRMHSILRDIDLVIGHEVLCDLDMDAVRRVFRSSYSVLRDGGVLVHSEFSPTITNRSEELIHIANRNCEEPISNTDWFSPTSDELASIAQGVGFASIKVRHEKIPIKFTGDAAVELCREWRTRVEFLEKYNTELIEVGLEFPMEQILLCTK